MAGSNKYRTLLKDLGVFAFGSFGSKVILFLLVPLYSTYMTQAEFGTSELVFSIGQLAAPIASLAVYEGVLRFGLTDTKRRPNALLGAFVVSLLGCLILVVCTPLFGRYEGIGRFQWFLTGYAVAYMMATLGSNFLRAKNLNRAFAVLGMCQTLLLALSNILFLVWMDFGVEGYLWSLIISNAFFTVAAFTYGNGAEELRSAKWDGALVREMLVFSAPLALNSASWWIIQSSGKVLLDWLSGAAAVGLYAVATKIPSLLNVFVSIFAQAWGISSIRDMDGEQDLSFYRRVFGAYQALIFMVACVATAISQPLVKAITGPDFAVAWRYVPLLLVGAVFSAVSWYYGTMYIALKRTLNGFITTVVAAGVNLLCAYMLIPWIGIWGASAGVALAYAVLALMRLFDVSRILGLKTDLPLFTVNSVVLLAQALAVVFSGYGLLASTAAATALFLLNVRHLVAIKREPGAR